MPTVTYEHANRTERMTEFSKKDSSANSWQVVPGQGDSVVDADLTNAVHNEAAERRTRAMDRLCDAGLAVKVSDMELWHGRAKPDNEVKDFAVDPHYDNAYGGRDHANVGGRPILYAADKETAEAYASKRSGNRPFTTAEIHRIVSNDPQAVILNDDTYLDWIDQSNQRPMNQQLFADLAIPATLAYAPIRLRWAEDDDGRPYRRIDPRQTAMDNIPNLPADLNDLAVFADADDPSHLIRNYYGEYSSTSDNMLRIYEQLAGVTRGQAKDWHDRDSYAKCWAIDQAVSIYNTAQLLKENPALVLYDTLVRGANASNSYMVTLSPDFAASWAKANHVIGVRAHYYQSSLNRPMDAVTIFDLNASKTLEQLKAEWCNRQRTLGKLCCALQFGLNVSQTDSQLRTSNALLRSEVANPLDKLTVAPDNIKDLLQSDLWATPDRLVKVAGKIPTSTEKDANGRYIHTFAEIFASDAGNWEGYTLGEHTATVLRNFDNNYADKMPAQLLPIMRLSLLVHDIGKARAAAEGDKAGLQEQYNRTMSIFFMAKAGIDRKTTALVASLITEGKSLAELAYVKPARAGKGEPNQAAEAALDSYCREQLRNYSGDEASDGEAIGLRRLCLAIQTCDSAAYTRMGITHDTNRPEIYYRNYGSFDESFKHTSGPSGTNAELKSVMNFEEI